MQSASCSKHLVTPLGRARGFRLWCASGVAASNLDQERTRTRGCTLVIRHQPLGRTVGSHPFREFFAIRICKPAAGQHQKCVAFAVRSLRETPLIPFCVCRYDASDILCCVSGRVLEPRDAVGNCAMVHPRSSGVSCGFSVHFFGVRV